MGSDNKSQALAVKNEGLSLKRRVLDHESEGLGLKNEALSVERGAWDIKPSLLALNPAY